MAAEFLPTGYNVIVAAGQSNMQGAARYDASDQTADNFGPGGTQLVKYFGTARGLSSYGKIVSGVSPITLPTGGTSSGLSPAEVFARAYAEALGRPVLLVPVAVANTGLAVPNAPWAPLARPPESPATQGNTIARNASNLYANMLYEANRAVAAAAAERPGSALVGLLWVQGEKDGDAGIDVPTYDAALAALVDGFRAGVVGAANSWFIAGSMLPEAIYDESLVHANYIGYRRIHRAQKIFPTIRSRAAFVRGSWGYADRAIDLASGQAGALHYRKRAGTVDLGRRMYEAYSSGLAQAYLSLKGIPLAPSIREMVATSGQSLRLHVDRDWSKGNTDLAIQCRYSTGSAWTDYYSLGSGTFRYAEYISIGGLEADTEYDVRVADGNSLGQSAWSSVARARTIPGGSRHYDFAGDEPGTAPRGITSFGNKPIIIDAVPIAINEGQRPYGKCVNAQTLSSVGTGMYLDKVPVGRDRTIIIRLGRNFASNQGVLDVIMRAQPDAPASSAIGSISCQGYRATINYGSTQISADLLDDGSINSLVAGRFFAPRTDQYFRVAVIASKFTLEYSADGVEWTTFFSVRDVTDRFSSGGVQLVVRNPNPASLYIASIDWA